MSRPRDFLSCLCGSERRRSAMLEIPFFLSCLCGSEQERFYCNLLSLNEIAEKKPSILFSDAGRNPLFYQLLKNAY